MSKVTTVSSSNSDGRDSVVTVMVEAVFCNSDGSDSVVTVMVVTVL